MAERVLIFEMAPRDGLQNEPRPIPTAEKIRLVDLLSQAGLAKIETASFVSPKWVPQMADAAEVMEGIARRDDTAYTALTPNMRGLDRAIAAGVDEVAVFAAASEGFSRANINASIAESLDRFAPVAAAARDAGLPVRGYVSCITDCPYDGAIAPEQVAGVARALLDMGCYEVSLGDTVGAATPERTTTLLAHLLAEIPATKLAGHFHDTQDRALENIGVCLDAGLRVFDASAGGLGGCPYAPGAKGNVDTLRVVELMAARGFETGLDQAALERAATYATGLRG